MSHKYALRLRGTRYFLSEAMNRTTQNLSEATVFDTPAHAFDAVYTSRCNWRNDSATWELIQVDTYRVEPPLPIERALSVVKVIG